MSADRPPSFARPPMSAEPPAYPAPGEGYVRPPAPDLDPVEPVAGNPTAPGEQHVVFPDSFADAPGPWDDPVSGAPVGAGEHGTASGWGSDGTEGGFGDPAGDLDEPESYKAPVSGAPFGSGEDDGSEPPVRITPLEGMNGEDRKKFNAAADRVAQAKRKLENEAGAQWRRVNRRKKSSNAEHHREMREAQQELHNVLKSYADAENLDSGDRIELSVQALDSILTRQAALADPEKRKRFEGLRNRIARASNKRWFKLGVPAAIIAAAVVTGIATGGLAAGGIAAVGVGVLGGGLKGAAVGGTVGKLQARGVRKDLNTREATQKRAQHQRQAILSEADQAAQNPGMEEEHEAFGRAVQYGLYDAASYERRENIKDRRFKVKKAAGRGAVYGAILGGAGALGGGYNLFFGSEANASEVANAAGGTNGETTTGHGFIPGAGETSPTPTPGGTEGATVSPTHGGSGNQGFPHGGGETASPTPDTSAGNQGVPKGDTTPGATTNSDAGNQGFKSFDSPSASTDSPYQGIPRTDEVVAPTDAPYTPNTDNISSSKPDGATAPNATPDQTVSPTQSPDSSAGNQGIPKGDTTPTPDATSKPPYAPEGNDHGSPSKPDGGATAPNTPPNTPDVTNAQINDAQEQIIEGMLQNDPDKLSKVTGFENFTPEADTKAAAANFKNGNTLWDKLQDTGKLNDNKTMKTIVGDGANKGGIEELSANGFDVDMGGDAQLTKGDIKFSGDTWWVENMKTPDGGSYVTMPNGDTFFYDGSLSQTEQAALLDQLSKGGEIVSPETMAEKMAAQIPDTPQDLENMGGTIVDQFNADLTTEIDKAVDPNETNPNVITGQKMDVIESFIAEHKQTLADLPENLQDSIANKIAQANGVPPEEVKKLMDEALQTATTANSSR